MMLTVNAVRGPFRSTMDAMATAVDAAEVMLFGVSAAYKESGSELLTV